MSYYLLGWRDVAELKYCDKNWSDNILPVWAQNECVYKQVKWCTTEGAQC